MKEHFNSCLYRITNCEFCKEEMIANELENHCKKDCPKFIIDCGYCYKSMTREFFEKEHTDKKCMRLQIKRLNDNINNLISKAKENEKENKEQFSILEKYILDLQKMIIELKNEKSGLKNLEKSNQDLPEQENHNEFSLLQKKRKNEKKE